MPSTSDFLYAINIEHVGRNVAQWATKAVPRHFDREDTQQALSEFFGGLVKELLLSDPGIDFLEVAHVEIALWGRAHGVPRDASAIERHTAIAARG
jgi:hypothetical protein